MFDDEYSVYVKRSHTYAAPKAFFFGFFACLQKMFEFYFIGVVEEIFTSTI